MIVKYKSERFCKGPEHLCQEGPRRADAMGSTGKKNSSTLEENELNYLLEKFSKDNSVRTWTSS